MIHGLYLKTMILDSESDDVLKGRKNQMNNQKEKYLNEVTNNVFKGKAR